MLSGISPWSILLILVIVVVLFGTKKLRNVGADLGSAIKSFKKSSRESGTDSTVSKKESSKRQRSLKNQRRQRVFSQRPFWCSWTKRPDIYKTRSSTIK